MHGRKRVDPNSVSVEEKQEKQKKIAKYVKLAETALLMRQNKIYTHEAFELTKKILEVNPEFYTLWNYRKEILLSLFEQGEDKAQHCAQELRLLLSAHEKNPKAYCVWHHRKWVIQQGTSDLQNELELCNKYLNFDSRNFHVWNYRRFIVALAGVPAQTEFQYTTSKIEQNFSNFSSWHYRTKLFPQLMPEEPQAILQQLNHEFHLVQQAFYTEPDDQSSWLYHRWLVDTASKLLPVEDYVSILRREISMCEELLSVEPNCKWALLCVASLTQRLAGQDADTQSQANERLTQIFQQLIELDPMRRTYYTELCRPITLR
eukprot:TRINITY_DN1510_c0_g1_i1.p1 TRINITY_DN1510_c0_g1~~TRINITY_DN1510_c0_g1_i1.p1  ORF type:complete len:318 (-),score=60.32 TRINITY_DN1510_c0_g1_i1:12-965(-)